MGVVISTGALTPLSIVSITIGFISFGFTLGTFLRVVWVNVETLTEAPHEVHAYLTNLRQELLEERASLRMLKKNCKHRKKERNTSHGREVDALMSLELDEQSIKTMSDSVRMLIRRYERLELPFLESGEEGIQQATRRRTSKRKGDEAQSPYYTHSAYGSYEKRPRSPDGDMDDEDRFWPQRVNYKRYGLSCRFKWLRRKADAQQLFETLSRLQTRRTARQVGGIAIMMHEYASRMSGSEETMHRIDDRLQNVVGVRRVE